MRSSAGRARTTWRGFQDQAQIGYTSWRDPPQNNMNAIRLTEIEIPAEAALGVAVDGSALAWPGADGAPALPRFDALSRQRHYVDVFNRGVRRPPPGGSTEI